MKELLSERAAPSTLNPEAAGYDAPAEYQQYFFDSNKYAADSKGGDDDNASSLNFSLHSTSAQLPALAPMATTQQEAASKTSADSHGTNLESLNAPSDITGEVERRLKERLHYPERSIKSKPQRSTVQATINIDASGVFY